MESKVTSRSLAIIGLFSALYIISSGIVSFITQVGYTEHFLRGILMTAIVLQTRKWSTAMMGAVCGIVFLFAVSSLVPYLLFSTFVSGLVFDLILMIGSYANSIRSVIRVLVGVAESVVAPVILTSLAAIKVFGTNSFSGLSIAWSTDIVLNIVLSVIGALLVIKFFPKKSPTAPNLQAREKSELGNGSSDEKKN
ncbi:MAG: hypothetical protein ACYCPP_09105 [Nitrososphaerales archaeon]